MEASRWDRLDELSRRLDRYETRLRQVEAEIELLARMDERLKGVERDVGECLTGTNTLKTDLAQERKEAHREHIVGRRWIIGSIIAASGVIVGAVGLIVAVIEKAPA